LRVRVAVASERAIWDIGTVVVHIGHHWLIHRAIPLNEARFAEPVAVHVLMVLMEDRLLQVSPLNVWVWDRWVLRQDAGHLPPPQIRVVQE
jgi:hypothetical protein